MKIRKGFVSNSSSSSFIIVGVTDSDIMQQIAMKDGKFNDGEYTDVECSYGIDSSSSFNYYGSYGEPYYIGVDISERLNKDVTLSELRNEFQKKAKDLYNIDIPIDKIKLHYGEVGDG